MIHRNPVVLTLTAPLLLLSACGAKQFTVEQAPSAPFKDFGEVEVVPFTVELPPEMEPERRAEANELMLAMRKRLTDRLSAAELFPGGGRKLTIKGVVVGFDPGSQAMRYFVGFGAGSGEIVVSVDFLDDAGGKVARGAAKGGVSAGMFGGNISSAARRLADAIFKFIRDNHEQVQAP